MSLKITHKYSTAAGTPPASGDIDVGEVAINAADAELYIKDNAGNIRKFQNTTTGTADGVQFTQTGTGAAARTVQSKLSDAVSVKDFGAVGDGVTDDTAAIQAAIDATFTDGGGAIYFGAGTYIISSTLSLKSNCSLRGSGTEATTLKLADSVNANILEAASGTVGAEIRELTIDGNQSNNTAGGVYLVGSTGGRGPCFCIEKVKFTHLQTAVYGAGNRGAVGVFGSDWSILRDCDFIDNDFAQCALQWNASDSIIDGVYIGRNGLSYSGTSYGLWMSSAGNRVTNCYFGGTQKGPQVRLYDAATNTFTNCIIDNSGTHAVELDGSSVGNLFYGCRIGNSSYSNGGTYYAFLNNVANSNAKIVGVQFYSQFASAPQTHSYYEPPGVNGNAELIGCSFEGTWSSSAVSVPASSTTRFIGNKGYGVDNLGRALVSGPYQPDAPSVTAEPLARINAAGTISLWASTTAYSYAWVQAIQDDGSNNLKPIRINPLGGAIEVGDLIQPLSDNVHPLGSAGARWSVVYAGTGTINTSDEREKQDIEALSAAELRVATVLKGLVKKFRFKDAVQVKGDDARIHVGVIAQEVIAAFQAEGLDPMRYGIVCYDQWDAELDEGNVEIKPAGDSYGIRYEELLAFIIAAL